jgi:hypothetical protein
LPALPSPKQGVSDNSKKKDDALANATPPRTPEEKIQRILKKVDDQSHKVGKQAQLRAYALLWFIIDQST